MKIPDLNVLIYARDGSSRYHDTAREWLERALSGTEIIGFSVAAMLGFVRVATNRRINAAALSAADAFDQVEEWLAQSPATLLHPGPRHLAICRGLLETAGTAGNLTSDAHLAALAMENGGSIAGFDSDFHRFPGLNFEYLR